MDEKLLLKIALGVSLLGLLGLFFISAGIELKVVGDLELAEEEEEVKVSGEVGRVTDAGKVVFLEILNKKVEEVKVVLFKEEEVNIEEGDYVEIEGTVEEYQGEKEIIGSKVVKK